MQKSMSLEYEPSWEPGGLRTPGERGQRETTGYDSFEGLFCVTSRVKYESARETERGERETRGYEPFDQHGAHHSGQVMSIAPPASGEKGSKGGPYMYCTSPACRIQTPNL